MGETVEGIGFRKPLDGCARYACTPLDFLDAFIWGRTSCSDDRRAMDIGKTTCLPEAEADRQITTP